MRERLAKQMVQKNYGRLETIVDSHRAKDNSRGVNTT